MAWLLHSKLITADIELILSEEAKMNWGMWNAAVGGVSGGVGVRGGCEGWVGYRSCQERRPDDKDKMLLLVIKVSTVWLPDPWPLPWPLTLTNPFSIMSPPSVPGWEMELWVRERGRERKGLDLHTGPTVNQITDTDNQINTPFKWYFGLRRAMHSHIS